MDFRKLIVYWAPLARTPGALPPGTQGIATTFGEPVSPRQRLTTSCVSALSERLGRAFCAQSSERHVTQRGTEDQGRERLVQTTQHIPRGLSRA